MNIFLHEFRRKLRSVLTWSLGISFLLLAFIYIGSTISLDTALVEEMMAAFPEELLISFGMDNVDIASPLGFFALAFTFCQIFLAIQASSYGFSLISVEESEMTADFLLAKPVSRNTILGTKLLAALASLTVTNAAVWISSFTFINIFIKGQEINSYALAIVLSTIFFFQFTFLGLGLVISLLVKRVRNVTPYAMGLAFGMYVFSVFGDMLGESALENVTPFKHFEPNFIISNESYDFPLAYISIFFIVVSLAASYYLYARRNIHSAS